MAGMVQQSGAVAAEPNVIPMIDVLLVVLVIFMIINARVRQVIPVQVPPPENGGRGEAQIVLELLGDGTYAINSQPMPDDQLDAALAAIYQNRPGKLLFVKAADNRRYQEVIGAMDRARGAGVQVIGMVPRSP